MYRIFTETSSDGVFYQVTKTFKTESDAYVWVSANGKLGKVYHVVQVVSKYVIKTQMEKVA